MIQFWRSFTKLAVTIKAWPQFKDFLTGLAPQANSVDKLLCPSVYLSVCLSHPVPLRMSKALSVRDNWSHHKSYYVAHSIISSGELKGTPAIHYNFPQQSFSST